MLSGHGPVCRPLPDFVYWKRVSNPEAVKERRRGTLAVLLPGNADEVGQTRNCRETGADTKSL